MKWTQLYVEYILSWDLHWGNENFSIQYYEEEKKIDRKLMQEGILTILLFYEHKIM